MLQPGLTEAAGDMLDTNEAPISVSARMTDEAAVTLLVTPRLPVPSDVYHTT